MGSRRKVSEVKRRIGFFRIDAGLDDAGQPIEFDPRPFIRRIDSLPFAKLGSRYSPQEDGSDICCWVEKSTPPYRLMLGKIRRNGWPEAECDGVLSPLPLPPNGGLSEKIHIVLFADPPYWFVGCEYNFHGPRVTRLAQYLSEKAQCPGLTILPLFRQDVFEKLNNFKDVRLFSLRVHPSFLAEVSHGNERNDPAYFLDRAQAVGDAGTVDVILRAGKDRRLPNSLIDYAHQILNNRNFLKRIVSGKVRGFSGNSKHVETLDMIHAQIVVDVKLPYSTIEGSPKREVVYRAIEEAYREQKDAMLVAAGFTINSELEEVASAIPQSEHIGVLKSSKLQNAQPDALGIPGDTESVFTTVRHSSMELSSTTDQ